MVKWLNHVTIAAPRNGANTHVVDPAAGVVVAGAAFTPTAGRLLVVLVEGPVTSSTPTGWTLPPNGSAVNTTGLYLWYRTAAGGDTFETTHNGSNFPVSFDIYEFSADTLFIAAASAVDVAANGSQVGPSLAGLDASASFRAGVVGQGISSGPPSSFTWGSGIEAVDAGVAADVNDGYGYSLVYEEDQATADYSVAATSTIVITPVERLVFALDVPTAGTEHPAEGTISTVSDATGEATALRLAAGSVPVTTAATGTAAARHAAAGVTPVVTAADGAATALRAASGVVQVVTGAAGTAVVQEPIEAAGTVAVVTEALGTANQRHTATGVVTVMSAANGAPQLRSGGRPVLVTDQCGWVAEPCECSALDTLHLENPSLAAAVEAMAVRHLFRWTGSRYAPCPVTVRPCRSDCRSAGQVLNFGGQFGHPVLWPGLGCACGDQDSCSCARVCQIELTGPVFAVDEVWIDGVLLPSSAYRVDNGKYLVRTDGECWPECNDLNKPYKVEGDDPGIEAVLGTWAVIYRHGLPVPAGGIEVAGVLACEIAKAICNDKSCALPGRVREVNREGVTIAMLDNYTDMAEGMTGLWLVDSWILTNRPGRASHFSVWSPETRERGRATGW